MYQDEDGLNYTIKKQENTFLLTDKEQNQMIFTIFNDIGYLTKMINPKHQEITIHLDSNHLITEIVDSNQLSIQITYGNGEIILTSPTDITILSYEDTKLERKLTKIQSKMGTLLLHYDQNKISRIQDKTGLQIGYTYYEQVPYRIQTVTEYGTNQKVGNIFTFYYHFHSTTIIDQKKRALTMTFNQYGNLVSTSTLESQEEISNAYGKVESYGTSNNTDNVEDTHLKNKLLDVQGFQKYIHNYLKNTSFEREELYFEKTAHVSLQYSSETCETGLKSLKVTNPIVNQEIWQRIVVEEGFAYTFSGYFKSDHTIRMALSYYNRKGELVETSTNILPSTEFKRYDVTIDYTNDQSDLTLKIYLDTIGTTYIDDIQLEEGYVANQYNLLENSDFREDVTDWNFHVGSNSVPLGGTFQIVSLKNGKRALKTTMIPDASIGFDKIFYLHGNAGDTYHLSFWYKNEGLQGNDSGYGRSNNVIIQYHYLDQDGGHGVPPSISFNPNEQEWQYFATSFIAEKEFDWIKIAFFQNENANDFYLTNLCLLKDVRSTTYHYDSKGNLSMISDMDNHTSQLQYNSQNQFEQLIDPKGNRFQYEYDNEVPNRVLNGISEGGLSNQVQYDLNGNPTYTQICKNTVTDITDGAYKIRAKGTKNYLKSVKNSIVWDTCNHYLWHFEKQDTYYQIKVPILDQYLSIIDEVVTLSQTPTLLELIPKQNHSYLVKLVQQDSYLKRTENGLELTHLIENDPTFEFYLEIEVDQFIETQTIYSDDGRFIKRMIDSNLHQTDYDIDPITGLTKSITNPKKQTTYYEYNDQEQITQLSLLDKTITYQYNNQGLLSEIIQGNRTYHFVYDDFLNLKQVRIGSNITLVTNEYEENNGNLKTVNYGNGQTIEYAYDSFDRVKSLIKMDDFYDYKYGNQNELLKVVSDFGTYQYQYDLGHHLTNYQFQDFQIEYRYDQNQNIANKQYRLPDTNHSVAYERIVDDQVKTMTLDDQVVQYQYDSLGRVIRIQWNDQYQTTYEYVKKGKRTTNLIKTIANNQDVYRYRYDALDQITHIYHNGVLKHRYYYDQYNQLVQEHNYETEETIRYQYDLYGNILYHDIYELNTYQLKKSNRYIYQNSDWTDQLTSYNGETIRYDAIGNPTNIGDIELYWINGRQLWMYRVNQNNITYHYDKDGIRVQKTVNGVVTNYYVEGQKIIVEKRGQDKIYYKYDYNGNIIGFEYQGESYLYQKNIQNDIIGIINQNGMVVAQYSYDSYGSILSVTDGQGNDIRDNLNHIGNRNPFRYRSYYYDIETGLYYLNTRYYNPVWGRFLNSDAYGGQIGGHILSHNIYCYGYNNPIMHYDSEGNEPISISLALSLAVKIILVIVAYQAVVKTVEGLGILGADLLYNPYYSKPQLKVQEYEKTKVDTKVQAVPTAPHTSLSNDKPCTVAHLAGNDVERKERLTIAQAQIRVEQDYGDVMCDNVFYAWMVASIFPKHYHEKPHQNMVGYYPHFHPWDKYDHPDHSHPHIWYYPYW